MNNVTNSDAINIARNVDGWRAFVPLLFSGFALIGMTHPKSPEIAAGYAACTGGALVAATYAIFIRNMPDFWSIIWRLYLAYVGASFVFGGLSARSGGAAAALGASIAAGVFIIPLSVALFFWDNLGTKIISFILAGFAVVSLLLAIF